MRATRTKGLVGLLIGVTCLATWIGGTQAIEQAAGGSQAPSDKENMQGLWQAVELEANGQKAPKEAVERFRIQIKGDKLVFTPDIDPREHTLELDPNAKPATMDLTPSDGPAKGKQSPCAIYECKADSLRICIDKEGQASKRPREFKTVAGDGLTLLVLRRIKEDTKQTETGSRDATGPGSSTGAPHRLNTVVFYEKGAEENVAQVLTAGKQSCGACHSKTPTGKPLANCLMRSTQDYLIWALDTSASVGTHSIGVSVVPADATLRAQLALPAGEGLVVTNVDSNSAASEAGIAPHDLLLRLDDKPLGSPDDLSKQVDAVGEKPAVQVLLRNGKRLTLQVTPRPTKWILADPLFHRAVESRIWIGVELATPDDTLRSQLGLPAGQGVVVTNVIDDSPAAKAGVKTFDVLLMLGDRPISGSDDLRAKLQEGGEKPVAVKMVREAKPISIEVTPQKHQEPAGADYRVPVFDGERATVQFLLRPATIGAWTEKPASGRVLHWDDLFIAKVEAPAGPQTRVKELIAQVKDLQNALEALSVDLKKQQPAPESSEKK